MAALPWEWTFGAKLFRTGEPVSGSPETVRYMQSALRAAGMPVPVNGKANDRNLQDALGRRPTGITPHAYVRGMSKRGPRVLLVQQSEAKRVSSHRIAGFDAVQSYQRNNVYVERIGEGDLEKFEDVVRRMRPTIIHLVTGLVDGKEGAVYSELAPWLGLTAEKTTRGFQNLPADYLRPIILVETPLPPDNYGRAQQALLRNVFCDELSQTGCTRGVIGSGLYEDRGLPAFLNGLASLLWRRLTLGQLQDELIRIPDAFIPPALWTLDPDLPA
jgi:hypothetical protein